MTREKAKQHIEQIRRDKFGISPDGTKQPNALERDLRAALKNLVEELNAKETHFILELLQNAGDTNPPALAVYWPQNGAQLSGTNFTLRGWLDDPTANVAAQIVDGNGVKNSGAGLVERDGLMWAEHLPLGPGTNSLALTLTDAAGNVSMTNLAIIKSTVVVTIDDLSSVNVNPSRISVTGTINVTNHTVWVNGVKATLAGNGHWAANNVPVNEGGTAVIEAKAIPNTDNGGNGTGGNGGASSSNQDSGNPSSADGKTATSEKDKEPEIVTIHYDKNWLYGMKNTVPPPFKDNRSEIIKWDMAQPGSWKKDRCYGGSITEYYFWYAAQWGTNGTGGEHGGINAGTNVCGQPPSQIDSPYTRSPSWPGETCNGCATRSFPEFREDVSRTAHTLYELHTNGKQEPKQGALYKFTGSATGHANLFYPEVEDLDSPYAIDSTAITLGDLGQLDAAGAVYKALPRALRIEYPSSRCRTT